MKSVTICLLFIICLSGKAQYFQYSQYNFADQRVNPAMVCSSNDASASFIFRNQDTGGDIRLKTNMLSVAYPLLARRGGRRWSALGASLLDDRSGGIFTVQEASLSYAINVFLNRLQFLSLGFKGLYLQRRVNLDGLYTGSQYINDRGFDPSLFNGENMGLLRSDFATFSAGLYWQHSDRQGRKIAWWGLSFFDMNRPDDSFSGTEHQLNSTLVASGGLRLYRQGNLSLLPEFLLTHSAARSMLNIGMITSYEIKPFPNRVAGRVDLVTKYVPGRSGIAGVQFHREHFSVGFSYDFPLLSRNPGNTGAFELGLQIRRPVDPPARKRVVRSKKSATTPGSGSQVAGKNKGKVQAKADTVKVSEVGVVPAKDTTHNYTPEPDVRTALKQKTDSVMAYARAGNVSHEPFVIERLNLHFNFEFNSTSLDEATVKYLQDLSAALKENEHMKVKLTGHTDNVGSPAFNMRLSRYRAEVVKQFLIEQGVDPSRIESVGKGLTEPLNGNKTEGERALNRRVELLIYYQE